MNKFILGFLTLFSFQLFAMGPIVEEVVQMTYIDADCELCAGGALITETVFTISDTTCKVRKSKDYKVNVIEKIIGTEGRKYKFVEVVYDKSVDDCDGPSKTRRYKVYTEDLDYGRKYILANPSLLKVKSEKPFDRKDIVICPAVACPLPGMVKDENCNCVGRNSVIR